MPKPLTPYELCEDAIAICVRPSSRGWWATLEYAGKSFDVFDVFDNHTSTWPTEIEAMRAADAYRKTWHKPGAATLAHLDRRANEPSFMWTPFAAQLRDDSLDAAWRRRYD